MSLAQTYYVAQTARGKLSKEASRSDHNLRLLVGHANLLDVLMLDLADAEREQDSWFNQTFSGANKASAESRRVQWVDSVAEEAVEEVEDSEDESDSDDEELIQYTRPTAIPRRRAPSPPARITTTEVDEDDDMDIDDDYEADLVLTRTSSRPQSPPELTLDSDSDSDDDMPPSPPTTEITLDAFSEKQRQAISTTSFYTQSRKSNWTPATLPTNDNSLLGEDYYLPQQQSTAVAGA